MELTITSLIKIIIGVLVFVVVIVGIGYFFRNYVLDFFENIVPTNITNLILGILK